MTWKLSRCSLHVSVLMLLFIWVAVDPALGQETETAPKTEQAPKSETQTPQQDPKPEVQSEQASPSDEAKPAEPRRRQGRQGGPGGRQGRPGGPGRQGQREGAAQSTAASGSTQASTETKLALPQAWADQTPWRSIGPANMSGRVIALAVSPKDPTTWWGATASGGLIKTTNNGITFEHQFDKETTVSIGDVQVAPSNPDILWVGTGEHNPRNSASWGDGVYKSIDGGKTWANMGLKESFQVGRMAIHPENPDIVWVGALGRLWGANKERGLFKTIDGGKTWKKVLYINQDTGVIDVKLNPKNPNEMLVATYECRRGQFDDNDPMVRFGAGSAIYRSTDGGESFTKSIDGLPTCKLGRIGLDYYQADPKYVLAIVESEKIAALPEKWAFIGVRGENADVGARLTNVVNDSPAAKAGLKVGDIIVLVDGELATDYPAVLALVRKKQAGEKLKVVITRERKKLEMEVELAAAPAGQTGMNPFVGELGGQAANLQEQQGRTGAEHGGLFLSEDGGLSWTRINTLNPRPMYFSDVRFDPTDRNNIYVCGVSLFRSKDGGKTFQGDGGRNVHPDNQALWINPSNPKHMILATDGGIYMTYDRMENWDHLNNVAIGQFYHVGIDTRLDYNVYGGLQDNGSWGGPSRGKYGEGPVNTDWFRIGSGDGFVTHVDPEDPDQIYYESQNGFMARVHLKTGERGSAQPRERGQRFRFNWKTPYMLSPHNSRTHYSVGNFVFKSTKKGTGAHRISPEITNSDKGSGSAVSESPLEEGVIYAGTTDGAVWLTRDGGKAWQPLFSQPEPKSAETGAEKTVPSAPAQPSVDTQAPPAPTTPSEKSEPESETQPAEAADPVTGTWKGVIDQEGITEGEFEFTMEFKKDAQNAITGTVEAPMGELAISSGSYDPANQQIEINVQTDTVSFVITGTIKGDQLEGKTEIQNLDTVIEFVATRIKPEATENPAAAVETKPTETKPTEAKLTEAKPTEAKPTEAKPTEAKPTETAADPKAAESKAVEAKAAEAKPADPADQEKQPDTANSLAAKDDPVSGKWSGVLSSERGEQDVTITMQMNAAHEVTGRYASRRGEQEFTGKYDPEKKWLELNISSEQFQMVFEGRLENEKYVGDLDINSGRMGMAFEFKRDSKQDPQEASPAETKPAESKPAETKPAESKPAETKPAETKPAETKPADPVAQEKQPEPGKAIAKDDPVSGKWSGTFSSERGEQDVTMTMRMNAANEVTGSFVSTRGEREFAGKYDPEKKQLTLAVDSEQFQLSFDGKLENERYVGELDFNSGQFSMTFDFKRDSKLSPEEAAAQTQTPASPAQSAAVSSSTVIPGPTGEKTLSKLLPGPRWVSSIEASRFRAGRCYITLDGHRSNDDSVYVFVTNDYGQTWESIKSNLPATAGSVQVLREDLVNENVLYLGCEFSAWFSIDAGKSWTQIKGKFPTVAVHDFAIHPKAGELVAATHGRSLWIADINHLRQFTPATIAADSHLYQPKDVTLWQTLPSRGDYGTRRFVGENPTRGAQIAYSLGQNAGVVNLVIKNIRGEVIKTLTAPATAGLHTVEWGLDVDRRPGGRGPGAPGGGPGRGGAGGPGGGGQGGAGGGGQGGPGGGGGFRFGPRAAAGEYLVVLEVDGKQESRTISIKNEVTTN